MLCQPATLLELGAPPVFIRYIQQLFFQEGVCMMAVSCTDNMIASMMSSTVLAEFARHKFLTFQTRFIRAPPHRTPRTVRRSRGLRNPGGRTVLRVLVELFQATLPVHGEQQQVAPDIFHWRISRRALHPFYDRAHPGEERSCKQGTMVRYDTVMCPRQATPVVDPRCALNQDYRGHHDDDHHPSTFGMAYRRIGSW